METIKSKFEKGDKYGCYSRVFNRKNNKILMVKEAKKKCYGQWNFPAGHVEENELVTDAAIREAYEETGCKVK